MIDFLSHFDVSDNVQSDDIVFDFNHKYILPGFVDVHVHFREPGFSYKETIGTGSKAAAHGGFTTVFTMPNLIHLLVIMQASNNNSISLKKMQ